LVFSVLVALSPIVVPNRSSLGTNLLAYVESLREKDVGCIDCDLMSYKREKECKEGKNGGKEELVAVGARKESREDGYSDRQKEGYRSKREREANSEGGKKESRGRGSGFGLNLNLKANRYKLYVRTSTDLELTL